MIERRIRSAGPRGPAIFFRTVAASCSVLVLALAVLAVCPEAHHWLHHDSDEPNHECAIVVFAHGITPTFDPELFEAVFLLLVLVPIAAYCRPDISSPSFLLKPERGPPRE